MEENIALPLKVMGEPKRRIRHKALEMAHWVGLKDEVQMLPPVLSGGQKQRVAIARAVITNPDIILADEPSSALDEANTKEFFELLLGGIDRTRQTLLVVSHDTRLRGYFDHVLAVEDIVQMGGGDE